MFYWLQQLYGNIERAFTKKIFARFGPNHHYNTLSSVISYKVIHWLAGPRGRAVKGVGLRPLASWDCGFESHRGNGCLVCCECFVLSGRGLCNGPIPPPEEVYRVCVCVCHWVWSHAVVPLYTYNEWVEEATVRKEELGYEIWYVYSSYIYIYIYTHTLRMKLSL